MQSEGRAAGRQRSTESVPPTLRCLQTREVVHYQVGPDGLDLLGRRSKGPPDRQPCQRASEQPELGSRLTGTQDVGLEWLQRRGMGAGGDFKMGFHMIPSMHQLHLHVISQVCAGLSSFGPGPPPPPPQEHWRLTLPVDQHA